MDNRLDFITKIEDEGIKLMTGVRQVYIDLDDIIRDFSNNPKYALNPASSRALALARTYLENSLQYTIKTLCLQYEIKA